MKFLSNTKQYYKSLNGEDQKRFMDKYFKTKTFDQMPYMWTSIWDEMTTSQRGAIWLDFTKVGRLLECDKEVIYGECLKSEELRHIWLEEYEIGFGMNKRKSCRLRTLSELSKDEISEAITPIRDFLLKLVKEIYQNNYMIINWSCEENIGKPDAEFLMP